MPAGRFAPSPTADLHVGNLRTALLAWLFARSDASRFTLRIEDLDPVAADPGCAARQIDDLGALGIAWDGLVRWQHEHLDRYEAAIDELESAGLTYLCFCTRREIQQATVAPHGPAPEGAYPGTCRELTEAQRAAHRAEGRPGAVRLRAGGAQVEVVDRLWGAVDAVVDDFVIRRNDGAPAYNLAVVVDDAADAVGEVVRGDDLLLSSPRQAFLADRLGLPRVAYVHVPLVLGPGGDRLAKRDGAVTLAELGAQGVSPDRVRSWLASSLGLAATDETVSMDDLLARFDPERVPREPWVFSAS
jgi:glutamyl-tRNA synthetase